MNISLCRARRGAASGTKGRNEHGTGHARSHAAHSIPVVSGPIAAACDGGADGDEGEGNGATGSTGAGTIEEVTWALPDLPDVLLGAPRLDDVLRRGDVAR